MAAPNYMLESASKHHAYEIARCISAASKEALFASGGWFEYERYVRAMLNRSADAFAARALNRDLLAVVGVLQVGKGWHTPWIVTTRHAAKHPRVLLSFARNALASLRGQYPRMVFYAHAADHAGMRIIKKLGLKPETAEPHGARGDFFCRVVIDSPRLVEV